jgi:hypothetical protein
MKQTRFFLTQTNAAISLLMGLLAFARLSLGQTNLITNGGFESGSGNTPTSWTASSDNSDPAHYTWYDYAAHPTIYPPPSEGTHAIVFNDGNAVPNAKLSQTVSGLTSGHSYTLIFDLGVNSNSTTDRQQIEVSATNASPSGTTFTIYGVGATSEWQHDTKFTFEATSTSTTITFHDVSPMTNNIDVMLDNVRLAPTLTPALDIGVPGLLRVSSVNPRYFTSAADPSGKAIYVAGFHNWEVLQDRSDSLPFNYSEYLAMLQQNGLNFFRMWYLDTPRVYIGKPPFYFISPRPFNRATTPTIYDGDGEYQMTNYNDSLFFDRLHDRCEQAQQAGIYVDVMLSCAGSVYEFQQDTDPDTHYTGHDGWYFSYWNPDNSDLVNSVTQAHAYTNSAGTEWLDTMKAFMHHMIDAVHDLDNVVFEITNEGPSATFAWQNAVIQELHTYEASLGGRQHLIGFTAASGGTGVDNNHTYLESDADWVSLSNDGLASAVPDDPATISPSHVKPDVLDTDHTYGVGGNTDYLWSSMMRGHNNIYMDDYGQYPDPGPPNDVPAVMHSAMGAQRQLAQESDLIHTVPVMDNSIVSTEYGLVHDDFEYLAYWPAGSNSSAQITITGMAAKSYNYQWLDPVDLSDLGHGTTSASGSHTFSLGHAASGGVVLHVRAALDLASAVSRKTHTGVGAFDINLPLSGSPGIECRTGGTNGDHQVVFTFTNTVVSGSASVTSGTGSVSGSPTFAGNTMTVNLTGVSDIQELTVTLSNVMDNMGQTLASASATVGILFCDVGGNRAVTSSDVTQTQFQSGNPASATNFRTDVNCSGAINATDKTTVQSNSGHALP